jgi:hypothetical protein
MGFFKKKASGAPTRTVLLNGGQWVDVVGESNYQDALSRACGGRRPEGHNLDVTVLLVHEPDNVYDPNAVGVYLNLEGDVKRNKVGHLSRDAAIAFKPVAQKLSQDGYLAAVRATIRGGWSKRGKGESGHFGISLDLAPPDRCLPEELGTILLERGFIHRQELFPGDADP